MRSFAAPTNFALHSPSSLLAPQAAALAWHSQRAACVPVVQKALELRSQATYVTESRVEGALGCAVQASRLAANVNTELQGRLQQWKAAQQSMLNSLQTMSALCQDFCSSGDSLLPFLAEGDEGGVHAAVQAPGEASVSVPEGGRGTVPWPLDPVRTSELLSQLQQQTLLEISIYEVLRGETLGAAGAGSYSAHDATVTYLACFTYPPYLSESALNIVLEIQE